MSVVMDPSRFALNAAVVDWSLAARSRPDAAVIQAEMKRRGTGTNQILHLRWAPHPEIGLPPGGPYEVAVLDDPRTFTLEPPRSRATLAVPGGAQAFTWSEAAIYAVMVIEGGSSAGVAAGVYGTPMDFENVQALASVPAGGPHVVALAGGVFTGVILPRGARLRDVFITPASLGETASWRPLETVGLPVEAGGAFQGTPWEVRQGFVGAETTPRGAAIDRLKRGAPYAGWLPQFPSGEAAPAWTAPDHNDLVDEINAGLLPRVRPLLDASPFDQAGLETTEAIAAPAGGAGSLAGAPSTATLEPLGLLLMSALSEPFANLALGYGTAYDLGDPRLYTGDPVNYEQYRRATWAPPLDPKLYELPGARELALPAPPLRVTGKWPAGLDGRSTPTQLGMVVLPQRGMWPTPAPADLEALATGLQAPPASDDPWRGDVRLRWERFVASSLVRPTSFVVARRLTSPAEPAATLLNAKRAAGDAQPIAITDGAIEDPEREFNHFTDESLDINTATGLTDARYAVAQQNLYGLWGPWRTADARLKQPPLEPVRISRLDLIPDAPASASGPTPATLTLEFVVDWRVRSPADVRFVARLYPAARRADLPPSDTPTSTFARGLGRADAPIDVVFSGDAPSAPIFVGPADTPPVGAAYVQAVEVDPATGDDGFVDAGPPHQDPDARRFRLTVPGFTLDFDATPHIGLAVWGRMKEQSSVGGRVGPWPARPSLTAVSDPRPPQIALNAGPTVHLASLPDAAGQAHYRLSWPPAPNASGYVVYQSTETKVLDVAGQDAPALHDTLSDRLAAVRAAYAATPSRRGFTRLTADQLPADATSLNITLPRGSTDIHLYTVIGVSPGQIEGPWPTSADALMPVAAPRIVTPAPPTLMLDPAKTTTGEEAAKIRMESRGDAPVSRLELHRVRNAQAALRFETMGPPVARLEVGGGAVAGWTVTTRPPGEARPAETVIAQGLDAPAGSWTPTWYRAVAWARDDLPNAKRGGRSPASGALSTVVPPASAPVLSPLTVVQPGADPREALVEWTCDAPLEDTPLGAHRLQAQARLPDRADRAEQTPIDVDVALSEAPQTGAAPNTVWITPPAAPGDPVRYHLYLRRLDASDRAQVSVRVVDPLGRAGQATLDIAPGSVEPEPDVVNLSVVQLGSRAEVSFVSSAPTDLRPAGAYRVEITAARRSASWWWFGLPLSTASTTLELPGVPQASAPAPATSGAPLTLARVSAGPGPQTYAASVSGRATRVDVAIIAPDGRRANASWPITTAGPGGRP